MTKNQRPAGSVLRIERIALNVADLNGACAFYTQALGFTALSHTDHMARLVLGAQTLDLAQVGPSARRYPEPLAANDPWFQHFAIAVSDMGLAYAMLTTRTQQPISEGGPQLLPPSTGSVTAYKFRDPDGHPLELSYIPGSPWLSAKRAKNSGPFLGIDHSAVAVQDLDRSVAFYTGVLALSAGGRSLNRGPEQDRLDGLANARVDIVALNTMQPGPHIELLRYRSPQTSVPPCPSAPDDIAATRLVFGVSDLGLLTESLQEAGAPWTVRSISATSVLASDPDGHLLEFIQQRRDDAVTD